MKYIRFLWLITVLLSQNLMAQKNELVNSGEILKTGTMLYDSGKYKSALVQFEKVNRSDTNYVRVLYEKALACEADSQFNQAIKYCREGLAQNDSKDNDPDFYNIYGNTLNDAGQSEKALTIFDIGIAKYPSYALLYFNKGIAYLSLKKPVEAEQLFQQTLLINPYMYSAHYQLGVAAIKQGKIVQSFLSFLGYLLTNPSGRYSSYAIGYLNGISKGTDDVLQFKNQRKESLNANYQQMEEIMMAKLALDKAYKPLSTLDDPIVKQIQVVFEKLDYNNADNDFYIQYYLPYYKEVFSTGQFEVFINHSFSNVKIKAIQDYNKNNKKELDSFVTMAAKYFNTIRFTRELNFNKRALVAETYIVENGSLVGKGTLANNGKILTGKWTSLYAYGNLKCEGTFDQTGQRQGHWIYYYFSGKLKSEENYKNGKLDGVQDFYFENGNKSSHENYLTGKAEGLVTSYYYSGALKSIINYKEDKQDGEAKEFYSNGSLQTVTSYTAGLQNGNYKLYYKSGRLKDVGQYNNGKSEGPYKSYFESGSIATEGQYVKDAAEGEFKYCFENGKLKEQRTYLHSVEEGLHQEFFDNGQLAIKYVSKKGKMNGEIDYYGRDGKISATYIADAGVIKSTKYYAPSGKLLSVAELKNDYIDVVSYSYRGDKQAHYKYNKKGDVEGIDTLFYPSGKVDQIRSFQNSELNGPSVSYYRNGKRKVEINMVNGKDDGYYASYYASGQLESEGWMKTGQMQGEWLNYNENGTLTMKTYYLNGDIDGYKEEYSGAGKKIIETKYHRGWIDKLTQFDTTGNVLAVDTFPKCSGKFTIIYPNKQVMINANYVNGDFDGPYKTFYFDGSLESSTFFKKGVQDSLYNSFYYGGVKYAEGFYKNGVKTGLWKTYFEDGKIYTTENYLNDEKNGDKTYYTEDGKKDFISVFKDDELNGIENVFDSEGALAYQLLFEDNMAKAYSYNGADGKLLPFIPINNNNGVLKSYFTNGKLSRECTYSDGVKNGINKIYYSNGQLETEDATVFGLNEGKFITYYNTGKVKAIYQYIHDVTTGPCQEFYSTGVLKKDMNFSVGSFNGLVKYFDQNGNLTSTLWYHYGKLLAAKK